MNITDIDSCLVLWENFSCDIAGSYSWLSFSCLQASVMGRWHVLALVVLFSFLMFTTRTPSYVDSVLNTKVSALMLVLVLSAPCLCINVSCISSTGAINRAAVEKEATITYDEFVNELDTGDSFTTSLVDILVKVTFPLYPSLIPYLTGHKQELAERHTRPFQQDERQLIAPRTAERLISLANPRQVYRGDRSGIYRNHAGRRTYNLAEFMHLPSAEVDIEEEDFMNFLDVSSNATEGTGYNNDFFDAYGSNGWPPVPRRFGTTPSPPLEDVSSMWRSHGTYIPGTVRNPSTWGTTPGASGHLATSIARHPSIRRPTRRMVDFNDWTTRRRSSTRDASHGEGSDGNSPFSLAGGSGEPSIRRFFPTVSRRPVRPSEHREEERVHPPGVVMDRERSSSVITRATESHSSSGSSSGILDDRPLPRLRRGGVRPLEMFRPNHHSWSAPTSSSRPSEQINTNAHPSLTRSPSPGPSEPSYPLSPPTSGIALSEPNVGYPTPGSIENEPTSV